MIEHGVKLSDSLEKAITSFVYIFRNNINL